MQLSLNHNSKLCVCVRFCNKEFTVNILKRKYRLYCSNDTIEVKIKRYAALSRILSDMPYMDDKSMDNQTKEEQNIG